MALWTISIYLSDPIRKVMNGFGLYGNGPLNDILPNLFLATILIGLSMDEWP